MAVNATSSNSQIEQCDLFVSGEGGYHTYRIPAVVVTTAGTQLAFCEGRKGGQGDAGEIHMLLRRSEDDGNTWSGSQIVWQDGENTCGNPCPVVDRDTGHVHLLMTHNMGKDTEDQLVRGESSSSRTVWLTTSTDDGRTWSKPRELTRDVMPSDWKWYATGPGAGIQLASGRLVIPCDHKLGWGERRKDPAMHFSHVIYSDDHGATWRRGGSAGPGGNECEVIERADGSLLLNMRSYRDENCRIVSISRDGGDKWTSAEPDHTLVEPVCQASIRRFTTVASHGKNRVLFSNPASTSRERMTIRLSEDDSSTWSHERVLWDGPAAYSCLVILPDMTVACFYERGDETPYERLTLARFNLAWITSEAEHL